MQTPNPRRKRLRGLLAIAAACAVGLVGFASPASAVDPVIDPAKKGSITLTKYSTPSDEVSSIPGNGLENPTKPSTNSTLLDGATFEIYELSHTSLSLKTSAGWRALETLISTVGPNPSYTELRAATQLDRVGPPMVTGAGGTPGVIEWKDLPVAAYYVVETGVPPGHQATAPFFVTVPMTDPIALNDWIYNIWVYPKNVKDTSTKVPLDKGVYVPGQALGWEVRTKIPGSATEPLGILRFVDTFSTDLTFNDASVRIGNAWDTATPLVTGDYTVTRVGQAVTVELTPTGVAKINTGAMWGQTILVRYETTVNANFKPVIENTVQIITNKPGSTDTTTVTPPAGETKFGKVTVNKTDGAGAPLAGAIFDVYYSTTETPDFDIRDNPVTGVAKTGQTCTMTGVTSCDLVLRFSDFAENQTVAPGDSRYAAYWLLETKAPSNQYSLLGDFVRLRVDSTTADPVTHLVPPVTVKNVRNGGGLKLPFAGGAGTVVYIALGASVLAGATALTVVRSRRNRLNAVK